MQSQMSARVDDNDRLADPPVRGPLVGDGGVPVDYGLLSELTGFAVKLVWIRGNGLLIEELGESGITPHRFSILEVIGRNPGMQQTQLAAALAMSRPAATLAIDFWEQRECVERRKIPDDRRSFGVFTTERGEQELERLRDVFRRADASLTADLSEAEVQQLRQLLKKIHG